MQKSLAERVFSFLADIGIASRNLVRNRRRSIIALVVVSFGVISIVLADGFAQWIFWAMREASIQSQLGHIEVVRPGYEQSGVANPFAYLIQDRHVEKQSIAHTPGVRLIAPRLSVTGLVSHGDTSISFIAEGVEPDKEAILSKALRIVKGRNLRSGHAREVILGRGLARNLGVEPGATVALLSNTESGGINAVEAKVAGLFVSANQAYDDSALRLPLPLAQSLIRVQGVHKWLILLEETDRTDDYLARFKKRFPMATHHLEFIPWYVRADFYNKTVALFSQQLGVLRAIIGVIIVLSISNMLVMNVLERTGEIGTLLALGFKRGKIMQTFALEGLVLGLLGGIIGVGVGYGLAELISFIGIPMPPPPGMEEGYTGKIRATLPVLREAFAIGFFTTALAGLYPAWKASRLTIVNALRHNI